MGIVKWCHPGDLVSMPPFGRYYRKKLVTLDCGLLVLFSLHRLVLVANGVSSSASDPTFWDDLFWFLKSVKYLVCCPISKRVETFTPFGMICFGGSCNR